MCVQRLDERSTGAGEEVIAAPAGAIGDAFLERYRHAHPRFPLTPARVLAALSGA